MIARIGPITLALLSAALFACGAASNTGAEPVTASQEVSVQIQPTSALVAVGQTAQFAAAVAGSAVTSVAWAVVESTGGSITSAGLYTPPPSGGQYHVKVTSNADPTKSAQATVTVTAPVAASSKTFRVAGNKVLDPCGNVYQSRGVEVWSQGLNLNAMIATGMNHMRIQWGNGAGPKNVNTSGIPYDSVMNALRANRISFIWGMSGTPTDYPIVDGYPWDQAFWADSATKAKVAANQDLIFAIDAMLEYASGDGASWRTDAIGVVKWFRNQGYMVPLAIMGPQSGRNLPAILQYGAEVVAADPLGKTIIGWQAYWAGPNTYYPGAYGMTLEQGIVAASQASFPIQMGTIEDCVPCLANGDTGPGVTNYQSAVTKAAEVGIGWQFWDWNSVQFGISDGYTLNYRGVNIQNTGYGFRTATKAQLSCP